MPKEWNELLQLTGGKKIIIEKVAVPDADIKIEGKFELPRLATLPADDQVFMAAFIKSHGSIKQMEKYFGISYPTVKNRLNKLAEKLDFVEIEPVEAYEAGPSRVDILKQLDRGEISLDDALLQLKKGE